MQLLQIHSPIGTFLAVTYDAAHLSGLWFLDQKHFPIQLDPLYKTAPSITLSSELQLLNKGLSSLSLPPVLHDTVQELAAYFFHHSTTFTVPLAPQGTAFQQAVWACLATIPYGATISYSQVAINMKKPTSTRPIASAIGKNPLSIIIPCHRVVGKNGSLTGYAGGLERKSWLLTHESSR